MQVVKFSKNQVERQSYVTAHLLCKTLSLQHIIMLTRSSKTITSLLFLVVSNDAQSISNQTKNHHASCSNN